MPLNNLYAKIVKLQEFSIEAEAMRIINENAEFLVSLLKSQLAKGVDGDGNQVLAKYGDFYADRTVFNKERHGVGLGKETRWVTNYMSGTFYLSIHMVTSGITFTFDSNVPYFVDIALRNSNSLMHLNKANLLRFKNEILVPQLQIRMNGV